MVSYQFAVLTYTYCLITLFCLEIVSKWPVVKWTYGNIVYFYYNMPSLCRQLKLCRQFKGIMKSKSRIKEFFEMADKIMKFTFRTDEEILKKLHFVAEYDARSANRELEVLVKQHIAEFEKEHGEITVYNT